MKKVYRSSISALLLLCALCVMSQALSAAARLRSSLSSDTQSASLLAADTVAPHGEYRIACDGSIGIYDTALVVDEAINSSRIASIGMIGDSSYNYSFSLLNFWPNLLTKAQFSMKVGDVDKDARALLIMKDVAGNTKVDTIVYISPKPRVVLETPDYIRLQVAHPDTIKGKIYNDGTLTLWLTDIMPSTLFDNRAMGYLVAKDLPIAVEPKQSCDFILVLNDKKMVDFSSQLTVSDTCISVRRSHFSVHYPRIINAESVAAFIGFPGHTSRKECRMTNDSPLPVRIDSIRFSQGSKTVFAPYQAPALPYIFSPYTELRQNINFNPEAVQEYIDTMIVYSNADVGPLRIPLSGKALPNTGVEDDMSTASPLPIHVRSAHCSSIDIERQPGFDEEYRLELFDLLGKLCYQTSMSSSNSTLHLNWAQRSGLYTLRLSSAKESWSMKLLLAE